MRSRPLIGGAILAAAVAVACGGSSTSTRPRPTPPPHEVQVPLQDANGATVGKAVLTPASVTPFSPSASAATSASPGALSSGPASGVTFTVTIDNLPPGSHGFHVHAVGRCDPPSFDSSGPHFNPTNAKHGFLNPAGPHAGDLPNLAVGSDGKGRMEFTSTLLTLDQGAPTSLRGPAGSSLIVDERVDDEVTQPDGNSGARIACGVIVPGEGGSFTPEATETPSPTATPSTTPTPAVRPATPTPHVGPVLPPPAVTKPPAGTPTPAPRPTCPAGYISVGATCVKV